MAFVVTVYEETDEEREAMATVGMIDMSGQPRSDEDLQEAINVCKEIMVKHSLVLPLFTLHAADIINCLEELQAMRRLLVEAKRKRLAKEE